MPGPTDVSESAEPGEGEVARFRTVQSADPARVAGDIATSLGAEVARGSTDCLAAVERRAEAARLVAAAGERPNADTTTVERIRQLAEELARADRIRLRTEVEFTEALSRKLSRGTALAVHPEALYGAARAVTSAAADCAAAEAALEALGPRPDPASFASPRVAAEDDLPEVYDEVALERARDRAFVAGIVVAAIGLGILLAVFVAPALAAVPVVLAVPVVAIMLRRTQASRREVADRRQAASSLAAAAATAEHATASVAASREATDQWIDQRTRLEAARDSAQERLRSASRAWESLAGPGADPADVETVVRARDPQFQLTGTSAQASPTVRTVNTFHRKAAARWKVLWATLDFETPPSVEEADPILAGFAAELAARELLATPLVLVEPFHDIDAAGQEEIEERLAALPPGPEIVLVLREEEVTLPAAEQHAPGETDEPGEPGEAGPEPPS